MTNDADIIIKINGIHLRKLSGSGNCFQNAHCHGNLHIALNRTCSSLLDQHGKCRDQHTVKNTGLALSKAIIMGSDHTKMLVFYPLLKGNHIFCHIPYFFDCAAAFDLKSIQNVLSFCTDCVFICDIVCNRPHLFPVKLLGIKEHSVIEVCFINVQIHHSRIWSADLRNVSLTKSSSDLSSLAPVFNLCLNSRISAFYHTCDHRMSFACSLKVCNSFAYSSAGIAFSQPGSNICMLIIQSFQLLDVYQHYRNIQIADCRKHIIRCSIGQHLKEYKINVCSAESVPCLHCLFLGCHHSSVNDLYRIRNCFFECSILCLKLRYQ